MSIPKNIYYCWFGGKEPPYPIKKSIESWSRVLPDYNIVKLDENDIDMTHPFNQVMLKNKKYAYLSDYMRLRVLKDHPGIYLDTDVYMIKPFTEEMLSQDVLFGAFSSAEVGAGVIGIGNPNDPLILKMLEIYDDPNFKSSVNTLFFRKILREEYNFYKIGRDVVKTKNITIYPREYFYPLFWNASNELAVTDNTIAIHLWTGSANRNNPSRFAYERHQDKLRKWLHDNYPGQVEDEFNVIINELIKGK